MVLVMLVFVSQIKYWVQVGISLLRHLRLLTDKTIWSIKFLGEIKLFGQFKFSHLNQYGTDKWVSRSQLYPRPPLPFLLHPCPCHKNPDLEFLLSPTPLESLHKALDRAGEAEVRASLPRPQPKPLKKKGMHFFLQLIASQCWRLSVSTSEGVFILFFFMFVLLDVKI